MAEKPILIFPAATVTVREGLDPNRTKPLPRPTKIAQGSRLGVRFQALANGFGTAQATPEGLDPEQVIVLETLGTVADFQNVVKRIQGLEWLGDFDADVEADDPGFLIDGSNPKKQNPRLFVLASNRTAYTEILKLWAQWQQAPNDKLSRNFGGLAKAFEYLNDVRAWGPKDRIQATGVQEYWEKGVAGNDPVIRFEVELWYRSHAHKRTAAYQRLQSIVSSAGGQCIKQIALAEIDYHGVLMQLPLAAVRQVVDAINSDSDTQLLRLTDVKYFAPMGQAGIAVFEPGMELTPSNQPLPTGEPVVAIFDGLPLTNHTALQYRLIVDDPDDFAAKYGAGEHRHGTAMASLIARAEYDGNEPALKSKIYVRPVMVPGRPDQNNRRVESFPTDELSVDLIHRAVHRMFEGEPGTPPQASNVKVINLSVGDKSQPFDRVVSPWARLLDWLAWKYRVLFVVSAGNHHNDLTIPVPPDSIAVLSDEHLRTHTLRAIARQKLDRRLLAPAESINSLTVGALHAQAATIGNSGHLIDLLRGTQLMSPFGTVASGFRRAVKPEILVAGGRQHYSRRLLGGNRESTHFEVASAGGHPGQLVAACLSNGISNKHTARTCGSSNAAALTTRRAAILIDQLRELQADPGGSVLTDTRFAVVIKAMLVHGASWGDALPLIDQTFGGSRQGAERASRIKRACAQFLGYGPADFDRGTLCTDQRVIVLGCGELGGEQGHIYKVPLPPALNAQTVKRRLTITLAWLTPINPRHRAYRGADLWFDPPTRHLKVKRTNVDHNAVTRGTVQHEVLEGTSAVPILENDTMPIQVNCRPEATSKMSSPIPYALLVTLETAQPLPLSIYSQVKAKLDALHLPVQVQPRP